MKSTKYQLLQADFASAVKDIAIRNGIIKELKEEVERYENALADIRNISTLNEYENTPSPSQLLRACYDIAREAKQIKW